MQAFGEAWQLSKKQPFTIATLGLTYARMNERNEAVRLLNELSLLSRHRYVSPVDFALIHAGLNEEEEAFVLLEKACSEHAGRVVHLKVEPAFDKLKTHPQFLPLLAALHLN
jgi:hypothetical protein